MTYWVVGEVVTATKMNNLWTELQYTQITSNVTSASTTESSPTTVIQGASVAVVAAPTLIEFYSPLILAPANATLVVTLWEGSTQKGRMCSVSGSSADSHMIGGVFAFRYTPSAASYVYKVGCHHVSSAGTVYAGAGGTGADNPAYLRILQKGA